MAIDIFKLGLLVLIGVGLLIASFTIVGIIAFRSTKQDAAEKFIRLFERSDPLRIITVGWIVIAATLLALTGVIKETAVVAILSGTVGYVLGGAERVERKGKNVQAGTSLEAGEEKRVIEGRS